MAAEPTDFHQRRPSVNRGVPSDSPQFTCPECRSVIPRDLFRFYATGRPRMCLSCHRKTEQSRSETSSQLTADRLRELLHYDPETGVFTRRFARGGIPAGARVGTPHGNGYLSARVQNKTRYLHRLAWLYITCEYPEHDIDHINGDRTDNRWSNLRKATRGENMQNQRQPRSTNTVGLLGVSRRNGRYIAQIQTDGVYHAIGLYSTPEEAHDAYVSAKRALHPFGTI